MPKNLKIAKCFSYLFLFKVCASNDAFCTLCFSLNTQFLSSSCNCVLPPWRFHEFFGDFCFCFFYAARARHYVPGQPKTALAAILVIGSLKIRPRCTGFTSPKSNSPPSLPSKSLETLEGGRISAAAAISATSRRSTFLQLVHLGASSQPYGISFLCLKLKIS